MTTKPTPIPADLLDALKQVVTAAQVAESRHPRCGAFAYLRYALRELPPDLRSQIGDVVEHEEDDKIDGAAEVRRLVAENIALRKRVAELTGAQLDLFGEVGVR